MSLLSQFFPSGGSGSKLAINMLVVGGGGGGTPSLPLAPIPLPIAGCGPGQPALPDYCKLAVNGGGGGGGGEVHSFYSYPVNSGSSITVTVGSGGGANSNGGNTSVCVSDQLNMVSKGGVGCANAVCCCSISCSEYIALGNNSFSGGTGARAYIASNISSPYHPTIASCSISSTVCNISGGLNYRGLPTFISAPPTGQGCVFHSIGDGFILRATSAPGGCVTNCGTPIFYKCINAGGSIPGTIPGAGGSGGGGSIGCGGVSGSGYDGISASPTFQGLCAGPGGSGGSGLQLNITGSTCCYGLGGGGGGGHYLGPASPYACIPNGGMDLVRGRGGCSVGGGCGGSGGVKVCSCANCSGCNGTANLGGGGGGGGGGHCYPNYALDNVCPGGSGGSGVVIIQYPTAYPAAPAFPGACNCSPSTPGCYTYKFNGPGSITLP